MIAIATNPRRALKAEENDQFVRMLPRIRSQARLAFRRLRAEHKDELVAEVLANAYCAFVRLVWRGKTDIAYATPLANYAIRQVIAGRQVGSKPSLRDIMSPQARSAHRIIIERLDTFDQEQGVWREALVEDRRATPADIAAARIDVAAWLRSLSPRNRGVAKTLAMGELPSEVARKFDLSRARISQLRGELESSWRTFQGEPSQPATLRQASLAAHVAHVA